MKCSSYHIISEGTWCQYNLPLVITLITWVRLYLSGFSTVKFLLFPFYSLFFGSKSQNPYYFKRRGFILSLLARRVSTYIIWNFSVGKLVLLQKDNFCIYTKKICVFACLFIQSFININVDIHKYLFYFLSCVMLWHFKHKVHRLLLGLYTKLNVALVLTVNSSRERNAPYSAHHLY